METERRTSSSTSHGQVEAALGELNGATAALVYVAHDRGRNDQRARRPAVARDFEPRSSGSSARTGRWQHIEEGEENAPSHIRAR